MNKEEKVKIIKELKKELEGDANKSSDEWQLHDKQIELVIQKLKKVLKILTKRTRM